MIGTGRAGKGIRERSGQGDSQPNEVVIADTDIAVRAYFLSKEREQTGAVGDRERDWQLAKAQLQACIETATKHGTLESGFEQRWVTLQTGLSVNDARRFVASFLDKPRLRVVRPDVEDEERSPAVPLSGMEAIVDNLEKWSELRDLASQNCDPLSLLSEQSRKEYAGRWVAIKRTGEDRGAVIACGASGKEAGDAAKRRVGNRPGMFAVRHLPEPDATPATN